MPQADRAGDLEIEDPPLAEDLSLRFYAVVDDDGAGGGEHSECEEGNNEGVAIGFSCAGPI